ncbi:MAG: hypothetical protein F8N39_00585 [Clostridiaceae bacterium]|nr:hypothetical protein [Clostridiaceae bacterium]
MKIKVYNKKKFCLGIVFLLLVLLNIPGFIRCFNNPNTVTIIRYIITDIFWTLFGLMFVHRSISSKCAKEDNQNNDERENLINIKSKCSAFNITLFVCIVITILSAIVAGMTKNYVLVGIVIGSGIIPIIMIFVQISSHFYHENRN